VEAAGADDEMTRTEGADEILAGQLAQPVNADRAGGIVLAPGMTPLVVEAEDVIGAEVDEQRAEIAADEGQLADGPGVDGEGGFRFTLGAVDEVVGGAVDDDGGADGVEEAAQVGGAGEVGVGAGERNDFSRQAGAEVAAELPRGP